jgi:hypothetical protein
MRTILGWLRAGAAIACNHESENETKTSKVKRIITRVGRTVENSQLNLQRKDDLTGTAEGEDRRRAVGQDRV